MGGSRIRKVFLAAELAGNGEAAGSAPGIPTEIMSAIQGEVLQRFGGALSRNGGAGFVAAFNEASHALGAALETIDLLEAEPGRARLSLRAGIHEGPVYEAPDAERPNGVRFVGAAPEIAERLLALASPNQILLGRGAFNSARLRFHSDRPSPLQWVFHGAYLLRGLEEPIEIGEAGASGIAPLTPPELIDGVERRSIAGGDAVGWRPAAGETVPSRPEWKLERLLGRGGSGEAWLARHVELGGARAFKFAFSSRHAKMLKRELTLGRLLRARLGERPEFQRHLGRSLEEAPYFLEMDYEPAGDLRQWFEAAGRHPPSLDVRLAILGRLSEAVALAHSIGAIHRDIKPSNVLVRLKTGEAAPRVTLADFGVGELEDRRQLLVEGITAAGFTRNELDADLSPGPGTLLYMAPELLSGRGASVQSDIYALGVIAYQLLLGDFGRPVAPGWEADITDPLLRDDVARCLDRDPAKRWSSAAELARSLNNYVARTEARWAKEAEERRNAGRDKLNRLLAGGLAVAMALGALAGLFFWNERKRGAEETELRETAERALSDASIAIQQSRYEEYCAKISAAAGLLHVGRRFEALATLAEAPPEHRSWEWARLARRSVSETAFLRGHAANIRVLRFSPDGRWIVTGDVAGEARIWDTERWRVARVVKVGSSKILDARFDPASSRAIACADEGICQIFDPGRDAVVELRGHEGAVNRAAFDPSGSRVATASDDKTARIWDAKSGAPLATLAGHSDWVNDLAYSPDGRTLATASDDGDARLWTADGELIAALKGHSGAANTLAFSPDGGLLLTAGDDTTIRKWNAKTGESGGVFEAHDRSVRSLMWLADGKRFASFGLDPWIFIWAIGSDEPPVKLDKGDFYPTGMAPGGTPDTLITVSRDGACREWNIGTGDVAWKTMVAPGTVDGIDAIPGAMPIAAIPDGTIVRITRVPPIRPAARINHEDKTMAIDISPDERWIATGNANGVVTLWSAESRAAGFETAITPFKPIQSVRFSNDGSRLLAGSSSGEALMINVGETPAKPTLLPHGAVVRSVAWLRDATHAATAGEDGVVKLWRVDTREPIWSSPRTSDWQVTVQELADGSGFYTAAKSGELAIYRFAIGDAEPVMLRQWTVDHAPDPVDVSAIDRSQTRILVASGSGRGFVLDARTGRRVCSFGPAGGGLSAAVFTPGAGRILAVYSRGSLQVINASDGRALLSESIADADRGSEALVVAPQSGTAALGVLGSGARMLFAAPIWSGSKMRPGIEPIYDAACNWRVAGLESAVE